MVRKLVQYHVLINFSEKIKVQEIYTKLEEKRVAVAHALSFVEGHTFFIETGHADLAPELQAMLVTSMQELNRYKLRSSSIEQMEEEEDEEEDDDEDDDDEEDDDEDEEDEDEEEEDEEEADEKD